MAFNIPAGYDKKSGMQPDEGVQGAFANSMSNTVSNFINRNRQNPLSSRADRYELGLTGGAARISDSLYIPPTPAPIGPPKKGRRKRRAVKITKIKKGRKRRKKLKMKKWVAKTKRRKKGQKRVQKQVGKKKIKSGRKRKRNVISNAIF